MRFIVENFGPIEKADIRIKDLNVFIGRNSTGKSYLAYLIWCFLAVEPDWNKLRELVGKYVPNELVSKIIEKDRVLHEKMKDKKDKDFDFKSYIKELDNISDEISKRVKDLMVEVFKKFEEIWGRNLEELIKDAFMVDDLKELIRFGKDSAKIVVCNDNCMMKIYANIDENGLTIKVDENVIREIQENLFITAVSGEPIYLILDYYKNSEELTHHEFIVENYQIVGVIPIIFGWVFDGYVPYHSTFIAPDGRDGLIRSREVYLHALLSDVVMNEIDKKFMRFLESLYPKVKNEKISEIASFIEEKLGIEFILQRGVPRYVISIDDLKIPIQRAPSGYKEIAPLIYAIKFGLDEDYTVIVEEPEAHLHPDAQVVVTRALAKLSKYANVIITTHSITVLDEISNLLRVRSLSPDEKKKLGYDEDEGLSPENLGIYLFSDGKVEELEIYEDGIEETELDRVIIEIANMHAKVEEYYERSRRLQAQR